MNDSDSARYDHQKLRSKDLMTQESLVYDDVLSPDTFDYLANLPQNIIIFDCEKCSFWMVNPPKKYPIF